MADNLKLTQQNIDAAINPSAPIGGIKAVYHNAVLKEVLNKVGRYTGLPFLAQDTEDPGGIIPTGTFVWGNNPMNQTTPFVVRVSKQTADTNDVGTLLNTVLNGSTIRFKDYVGRSVYLLYQSHIATVDGIGNDVYDITVIGVAENINYTYQPGEKEVCIIEFYNNPLSLPSPPGIDGDVLLNILGGFGTVTGFNYDAGVIGGPNFEDATLVLPMILNTRNLVTGTPIETVDFEGGNFVGTGFSTDGDQPWTVDTNDSSEGLYSAVSGAITGNQRSNLYKIITTTDPFNVIKFDLLVDSEKDGDVLDFYIDPIQTSGSLTGLEVYEIVDYQAGDDFTISGASSNANGVRFRYNGTPPVWTNSSSLSRDVYVDSASGSVPWSTKTYIALPGTYRLKWIYRKDTAGDVGNDYARVDFYQLAQAFPSANFNGFNYFNGNNILTGQIEFHGKVLGLLETNSDMIINGVAIGTGGSNVNTNIIIGTSVNKSGNLLSPLSGTNTVIGVNCFSSATDAKQNSGVGTNVMRDITTGIMNVAMGSSTLRGVKTGEGVVGFGRSTSDLPADLSNIFFVNDSDGNRLITIKTVDGSGLLGGAELPLQTDAFIDALGDQAIITRKYYYDNLTAGSGEVNTASNVGVGGIGIFKVKTGVNLEFKNLNAGSAAVSIVDDVVNDEVDIDINEMVGDSGAGGVKGAVPAPAIGDATKFLKGDATWQDVPTATPEYSVGNSANSLAQLVPTGAPGTLALGYNLLTAFLEVNETQNANSPIAYKDTANSPQATYLDEVADKFLFPSNLNTFGKNYVSYFIRTVISIDLSAVNNTTTKYYVRLRRVVDDSIIAVDEWTQSDFGAQNGLIVTSEMKTFVEGELDPFVVDGCYLDILNDSNSSGTVTVQSVSVRIFRD